MVSRTAQPEPVEEVRLPGGVCAEDGGDRHHVSIVVVSGHQQQLALVAERSMVGQPEAAQHQILLSRPPTAVCAAYLHSTLSETLVARFRSTR